MKNSKQNILRKNIYTLLITLLFTTGSCKKLLDLKPDDQLDESLVFTSVQRVESTVLGVYEGWYPEYAVRIASVIADECRLGAQNSGVSAAGQNLYRWTYSAADEEILDPWKNFYQVIDRVNRVLAGLGKVPVNGPEDQKKLQELQGELLAVRAYAHFDLYRIYGASGVYQDRSYAVPYMTVSDLAAKPSRLFTEAFFTAFWKDIKQAEQLLFDGTNIRMNLDAVYALHARAALYTGKYEEAAAFASRVIVKKPLATQEQFESVWKDQSNIEVIFKLRRTNVSTIRPGDLFYNIGAERTLFTPSAKLLDAYDQEYDVRFASWFDLDEDQQEVIAKYQGEENAQHISDLKLFRTGEMYLIRAEAKAYLGEMQQAAGDLNTLRKARVDNYHAQQYQSMTALKEAIMQERFKELPYEGHRYFDLKRLNLPVSRNAPDAEQNSILLPVDAVPYLIPVPQAEVQANPQIRPNNPGW